MKLRFLAIKGYWKHQHYHKRSVPWIKLYADVLDDEAFIQMPEAAQGQLMKLWVLASRLGHPLPNNPKLLAGKIGTTGKFHLASIVAAGFVVPCETDEEVSLVSGERNASKSLDESLNREEREESIETTLLPQLSAADVEAEADLAVQLATDADRNALTTVVLRASSRLACLAAFSSMLRGEDPATPKPTAEVFGLALRDMAMNGDRPSAQRFRYYLATAERAIRSPPTGAPTQRVNVGAGGSRRSEKPGAWRKAGTAAEEDGGAWAGLCAGNVETRRKKADGAAWWDRMLREAKAAGEHPTIYAYARINEPGEVEAHV